jgi:1,4-alpha-glucan branching enzyme
MMTDRSKLDAVAEGRHHDPFAVLGTHKDGKRRVVRTMQPQASAVALVDAQGEKLADAERVYANGLFVAELPPRIRRYLLQITLPSGHTYVAEDPYRFPSTLGEMDLYLLGEGSDRRIYEKLGAQLREYLGIKGTRFAVWAPNASRVSVIGSFNDWDGRRHPMRLHPGNGIWEIFIPNVGHGDKYKFEMLDRDGELLPLKSDPYAAAHEPPPGNASIVYASAYAWNDDAWMSKRAVELDKPMAIYEVHLGSWRRGDGNRWLSYRELADQLVEYVLDMGFTHVEFLPVSEHPFDGSWGYQPIGMFAPTWRFGPPDDFRALVDRCHAAGIGVIIDWVPAHFPKDEHGLRRFDGTALYEHSDPRKGEHADWGTLIFNFGRREVRNYLIGSALYSSTRSHRCCTSTTRVTTVNGSRTNSAATRISRLSSFSSSSTRKFMRTARPRTRKNPRRGPRCRGPSSTAGWVSRSSGTWGGCTTRWSTCRRTPYTAATTTTR